MGAKPRIVDIDRISMNTKRFLRPLTATILVRCEPLALVELLRNRQTEHSRHVGDDGHLVTAAHKSSRFIR